MFRFIKVSDAPTFKLAARHFPRTTRRRRGRARPSPLRKTQSLDSLPTLDPIFAQLEAWSRDEDDSFLTLVDVTKPFWEGVVLNPSSPSLEILAVYHRRREVLEMHIPSTMHQLFKAEVVNSLIPYQLSRLFQTSQALALIEKSVIPRGRSTITVPDVRQRYDRDGGKDNLTPAASWGSPSSKLPTLVIDILHCDDSPYSKQSWKLQSKVHSYITRGKIPHVLTFKLMSNIRGQTPTPIPPRLELVVVEHSFIDPNSDSMRPKLDASIYTFEPSSSDSCTGEDQQISIPLESLLHYSEFFSLTPDQKEAVKNAALTIFATDIFKLIDQVNLQLAKNAVQSVDTTDPTRGSGTTTPIPSDHSTGSILQPPSFATTTPAIEATRTLESKQFASFMATEEVPGPRECSVFQSNRSSGTSRQYHAPQRRTSFP